VPGRPPARELSPLTQQPDQRTIQVRAAQRSDRDAVLGLLAASLGWLPDEHFDAFFAWKHEESSFGTSPGWVATNGVSIVGFRTFMRWGLVAPDGSLIHAVRAVDTATHPAYQGQGIFRRLTLHALEELRADGVDLVFNTPNARSRPGYLKMGWSMIGRLPTAVRLNSAAAPFRMLRSRVPAERWSVDGGAAPPADEVLADPRLADLLDSARPGTGIHTNRTSDHLRWRYGFTPLAYRAVTLGPGLTEGLAIYRLRRRGAATECVLGDVIVPAGGGAAHRALVRSVARTSGADYLIRVGGPAIDLSGFVRLPAQGPILTWRPLRDGAPGGRLEEWDLRLGDVELF